MCNRYDKANEVFNFHHSSFRNVITFFWRFDDEWRFFVRLIVISDAKGKPNNFVNA